MPSLFRSKKASKCFFLQIIEFLSHNESTNIIFCAKFTEKGI